MTTLHTNMYTQNIPADRTPAWMRDERYMYCDQDTGNKKPATKSFKKFLRIFSILF